MPAPHVVTGLARSAVGAARHPVRSGAHAVGLAKGTATGGMSLAVAVASRLRGHDAPDAATPPAGPREPSTAPAPAPAAAPAPAPASEPVSESPEVPEPEVVLPEPGPPAEPPVDVVGEALAAEEETPSPPTAEDELVEDLKRAQGR